MNLFNNGDKVRVISLDATLEIYGTNSHMKVGQELVIASASASVKSGYQMTNNWWYVAADLELVEVPIVVATAVLTLQDVEEGDTVGIVNIDDSVSMFGPYEDMSVGDVFIVEAVDDEDDTVVTADGDWFYVSDLELVEKITDPRDSMIDDEFIEMLDEIPERDINYLINRDSVTLMIDGDSEVATKDHKNFQAIRDFVLDEQYDAAMSLMNVSIGIQNWGQGSLEIKDGKILYVGMELTGKLVDRIIEQMLNGDNSFERFAKFLNLTMEQENFETRSRLMDFAACGKLDINEDGFVVAFKNVREDFMDKHSGKFRNMIGDSPSMRRSDVDADHTKTCAQGLHVCSPTYLKGFWGTSGRTMRVVVDPRDFVGIPYDYNDSKARVCKYTVVEDVSGDLAKYLT